MVKKFEPKILGFLCNWCAYAGADLAGVSRIQYPPNIRAIRVMCSGRIDPEFVLQALAAGIDGVMIGGCHPGDCHYLEGNYQAEKNVKAVKKLLERAGADSKRLRLEWVSAGEGARFAEVIADFIDEIRELGPNTIPRDEKKLLSLNAAREALGDYRLRELVAHEREVTEEENVYGEKITQERFDEVLDEAIDLEFIGKMVSEVLKEGPCSVKQIGAKIGVPPQKILQTVVELRQRGLIEMDSIKGTSPLYALTEEVDK